jgi:excisionase family DNA binding protein
MTIDRSLLRVGEFASILGVTPACVRRWLLERKISSTRIGRLVRIPSSEVQRIVDSGFRPARQQK